MGYGIAQKGAKNLIFDYVGIRKDERVLVLGDTSTDKRAIDLIAQAARCAGGRVYVLIIEEIFDPAGSGLVDPPPVVAQAFYACEVVLSLIPVFKMQWSTPSIARAIKERGVRFAYIGPNTKKELAKGWARLPAELAFAIGKEMLRELQKGGESLHIFAENGTDLTVKVDPLTWGGAAARGPISKRGAYGVVPACTIGTNQIKEARGTLILDFLENEGPRGGKCELFIENSYLVEVKGGRVAQAFKKKVFSTKNANILSQISWGTNPLGIIEDYLKPPWNKDKMAILTRQAGVMHPGFGATPFHLGGETEKSAFFHTHGILLRPTVVVGKKTIISEGHLTFLTTPAIKNLAHKYGIDFS